MVNVTKANFLEASEDLIRRLPTASFVAIDEEMTGITLPGSRRPPNDDTPQQRYEHLKPVPERYAIVQVGVSLFHKNPRHRRERVVVGGEAANRNEGSNSSNDEQKENDDEPEFFVGIPYVAKSKAAWLTKKFNEKHPPHTSTRNGNEKKQECAPAEGKEPEKIAVPRKKVELTRPTDIEFVARTMASLREWIDNGTPLVTAAVDDNHNGSDTSPFATSFTEFVLPPCNAFLRRALYETVESTYPSLVLEKGEGPLRRNCIVVLRLTPDEKKAREEEKKKRDEEDLKMQLGFYRIFDALSKACRGELKENPIENKTSDLLPPKKRKAEEMSACTDNQDVQQELKSSVENSEVLLSKPSEGRIPLVLHNGLMDLLFLLTHFHEHTLPSTWIEAKALISKYFPLVYDTKCLAIENCPTQFDSTALGDLFGYFRNLGLVDRRLKLAPDFGERYESPPSGELGQARNTAPAGAHDAAYDAYMTGCVYVCLCQSILINHNMAGDEGSVGSYHLLDDAVFGQNRLHLMRSMYTIDLNSPSKDPFSKGLDARTTYRVSGIDTAVSTRDILRALTLAGDRERAALTQYEIIWIDDTSFFVAARSANSIADRQNDEEVRCHLRTGDKLLSALKARFPNQSIVTLDQYLQEQRSENTRKPGVLSTLVSGITGFFTMNKRRKIDGS